MKNHLFITFLFLALANESTAQLGGQEAYGFLRLPQSARVQALGGVLITVHDDDAALAYSNPAALNKTMHKALTFNTGLVAPGIVAGYAGYAHYLKKGITVHGGVQYLNYGKFVTADDMGNTSGNFSASDYAITLGASQRFTRKYSMGANVRFITSQLESYHSSALALDLAAMYTDTAHGLVVAAVLRNAGTQLSTYAGSPENVPTDLQIGISKRLRRLPFRISATVQHLNRWNIRYDDPNSLKETNIFGEQVKEDTSLNWLDNAARHVVLGGEFLLGKRENLRLRVGYNYLRTKELLPKNGRGILGLSVGVGLKISKFRIEYGHEFRHFAGNSDFISIATNLSEFK